MSDDHTTAVVQRYLNELAGDSPSEPIVRALLDRAVRRLHLLCATLLRRSYPRLAQPPSNVQADEMIYYVRGQFGSRRGVEQGSITLHPRGIPHGPHPGTIVASLGRRSVVACRAGSAGGVSRLLPGSRASRARAVSKVLASSS